MNPQIKELAREARLLTGWPVGEIEYQKFAELIVEECCKRLGEETIRHDGYGYNQHELYNRLRKHFGVEE